MATYEIVCATTSGQLSKQDSSTGTPATDFATVRNADTADSVDLTDTVEFIEGTKFAARGGGNPIFRIRRAFYAFDVSNAGLSSPNVASSVVLKVARFSGSVDCDIIVVKANKPDTSTNLAVEDFDAIPGFTDDATMSGNVTEYSSEIVEGTISATGYTEITLNADARSDVISLDTFAIAIIEHTQDYSNVVPTDSTNSNRIRGRSDGSFRPRIVITTADGYTHNVNGVAAANIAKVDGVATANIGKINGVD